MDSESEEELSKHLEEVFARLDLDEEYLLGFFAAVVSGPDLVTPQKWLPVLLDGPEAKGPPDPDDIATLMDVYATVVELLRTNGELVPEDAEDVQIFCGGYIDGARTHASWDEEATPEIATIGALAEDEEDDDEPLLAGMVRAIYEHFKVNRAAPAPKIGRNDPCPCGSGKKYKKCCLV